MRALREASVAVLGAGSYGTALAFVLARNKVPTLLWGRNDQHIADMQHARSNEKYLPGAAFPEALSLSSELSETVSSAYDILIVVPSHAFKQTLEAIKPFINQHHRIIWATKGLEPGSGKILQDVVHDVLGNAIPLAVVSGPTFAKEMVAGLPTAITLSSPNADLAESFSQKLHCSKGFRVYNNDDLIGVQLGGAVKNVIAIGAGLADGLGFGANARTALITRGLAEMSRLGLAIGAKQETFMGMAGLGDLVLTCTDNQSRNRRFGLALGQGMTVESAIESIGQVVEGYRNTDEVRLLSTRHKIEMPICEQIYQVLYKGKSAKEAAVALLSREQTQE
ncbi:NAD(P)H-dependent glycerol-3-phosphate dehydrogenase [Glaciecola sp. MH2013]|uniref:NAD(P)H-dependent glycerol-3-phosphate dehydrogenase n=1 Tax=Glaciecola sp. MH2013 TaxID=2785524 RepID=UPI00189F78A3|nr:NAD(P)H-dependent glycerol-3-phosphate dehydrogenase [Glaciecola sp. MH2013]MBF7073802.1 NAD(P)H-dependent glycerol-3-phosphate dehydrogenase [Glaciecola sp. MH2013]